VPLLPGRPEAEDLVVRARNSKPLLTAVEVKSDRGWQFLGSAGVDVGRVEMVGHRDIDLVAVAPRNGDHVDVVR
jgi:hypothetical protein